MRKQGVVLEDHPNAPFLRRNKNTGSGHQFAADFDGSVIWPLQSGNQAQQGSLPAAARSQQGEKPSLFQFQIQFLHRRGFAKTLGDAGATHYNLIHFQFSFRALPERPSAPKPPVSKATPAPRLGRKSLRKWPTR